MLLTIVAPIATNATCIQIILEVSHVSLLYGRIEYLIYLWHFSIVPFTGAATKWAAEIPDMQTYFSGIQQGTRSKIWRCYAQLPLFELSRLKKVFRYLSKIFFTEPRACLHFLTSLGVSMTKGFAVLLVWSHWIREVFARLLLGQPLLGSLVCHFLELL